MLLFFAGIANAASPGSALTVVKTELKPEFTQSRNIIEGCGRPGGTLPDG